MIEAHPNWVGIVIFLAAFGESLVLVGLFVPGTAILAASGVLVGLGVARFELLLVCAVAGAVLGDFVSYWLGRHVRTPVFEAWPVKGHPALIAKGIAFYGRYGAASIFLGRFFGPIRAIVPFSAGVLGMPAGRFMAANVSSALVWVTALLGTTAVAGNIAERFELGRLSLVLSVLIIAAIAFVAAMATAQRHNR